MTSYQVKSMSESLEAGYVTIAEKPGYPKIKHLEVKTASILFEIPTTLDGGNHGLLGLIIKPDEYEDENCVPFLCTEVKPLPYYTTIPNVISI